MIHFQNTFLISTLTIVIIMLVPLTTGIMLINYLVPLILFCAVAIILLASVKKKFKMN